MYINTHHTTGKDIWPPDQPKHFTTLVLLQQKHQPTQECVIALEEQATLGNIAGIMLLADQSGHLHSFETEILQRHLKQSKVTKNISELLMILESPDTNPRTLLIEGAPGIGKTYLLKYIAFEWANDRILKSDQFVFLLCLRDPAVQAMTSIHDLVLYFYKQDKAATKYIESFCTYLLNSNGKSIVFLLDGYDELLEKLQDSNFVVSIMNHQILPASGVVITSRPHATAHLHNKVAHSVTIMGFAEEDRRDYVKQSLIQKCQVDEVLDYLDKHPTVDNLCYIPFNLMVLIFLYKKGFPLPENPTQLYEYFICLTVRRYLSKHQIKQRFKSLDDLPNPYSNIIDQLGALSYTTLGKRQITFTLEEIRTACPEIDTIPEGINGLGLLQAVQHFGIIEETTTVNFLHLSLQEYLAAYHIAHLSPDEELLILHENLLNEAYSNTFLFYFGLTQGQRPAFKYFLSGGGRYFETTSKLFKKLFSECNEENKISPEFLKSLQWTLVLFRCFYEAGDTSWCDAIVKCKLFHDNDGKSEFVIGNQLSYLSHTLIENISLLLGYRQEWLQFHICAISVASSLLKTLHKALVSNTPVISMIILSNIHPSLNASQGHYIAEMVIACKTKVLDVRHNQLNSSSWIIEILLHKSSVLEELDICYNSITSKTACELFSCIKTNKTLLQSLSISENSFDDTLTDEVDACLLLEKLYLCTHDVTLPSTTVTKLFSSINKSSRLTNLCIRGGDFADDKVAYEIAKCFKHNCVLTHVELYSVKPSDEASLQMIHGLEHNTTLKHLDMRIKCSETLESKLKGVLSLNNERRCLSNKCLPTIYYNFDYLGSFIIRL